MTTSASCLSRQKWLVNWPTCIQKAASTHLATVTALARCYLEVEYDDVRRRLGKMGPDISTL